MSTADEENPPGDDGPPALVIAEESPAGDDESDAPSPVVMASSTTPPLPPSPAPALSPPPTLQLEQPPKSTSIFPPAPPPAALFQIPTTIVSAPKVPLPTTSKLSEKVAQLRQKAPTVSHSSPIASPPPQIVSSPGLTAPTVTVASKVPITSAGLSTAPQTVPLVAKPLQTAPVLARQLQTPATPVKPPQTTPVSSAPTATVPSKPPQTSTSSLKPSSTAPLLSKPQTPVAKSPSAPAAPPTLAPKKPQAPAPSAPSAPPTLTAQSKPPVLSPAASAPQLAPANPLPPPKDRPKARARRPRAPKQPAGPPQPPVMLPPQPNQQGGAIPMFNDPQMTSLLNMIYTAKAPQTASMPGHVKIAPRPPKLPPNFPLMPINMAQFYGPTTSFSGIDMHHLITPQQPQQQPSGSGMQQAPTFQVSVPMNAPPVLVNSAAAVEQRRGPLITEIDEAEGDEPPQLTSEVDDEVQTARYSSEASTALAVEAALSKGVHKQTYPIFHFIDGLVIEEGPTSFKFDDDMSDLDDFEEEETDSEAEEAAITSALVEAIESRLHINGVKISARAITSAMDPHELAARVLPGPSGVVVKEVAKGGEASGSKKKSPHSKKEDKKITPPVKEKVRKRRSKKTDELQKLLNMDFGPGEAPFKTTSKDEYMREMKKADTTPRRAAAVAAKKNMESMEVEERPQKSADDPPPPKRAAAVAARKSFEALEEELEGEKEVRGPMDLRPPPKVDTTIGMPRSAFDMPSETYCLHCRKSLRDRCYTRHPQYCSKTCRKQYRRGTALLRREASSPRPRTPVLPMQLKTSPKSPLPTPPPPNILHDLPVPMAPTPTRSVPPEPVHPETPKTSQAPPPQSTTPEAPKLQPSTSTAPPVDKIQKTPETEQAAKRAIDIEAAMNWTVDEVCQFALKATNQENCVQFFREHLFDGRAFLLLPNECLKNYPIKLGPKLKIDNLLNSLRPLLAETHVSSIQKRGPEVDELMKRPLDSWTHENVEVWATKVTGSAEIGEYFRNEEVDGSALLCLFSSEDQLADKLSTKRGPWLNLNNALNELKNAQAK
ncbi:hypothetical protein QR680_018837 [Steinernema hermaphroditum]|uniref:SAM domain-containing protein n=1 Tax=Steinernema hermaphroditum TaxID=289476 RepID=A0AA39HJ53_9BILA|nr:hypothetical protein QR680_018837 [Steinernema hermaphroditum]